MSPVKSYDGSWVADHGGYRSEDLIRADLGFEPIPYRPAPDTDWSTWTPRDLRPWRIQAQDSIRAYARNALHNVVAHPLLVLCPPIGRWLHDRTAPA